MKRRTGLFVLVFLMLSATVLMLGGQTPSRAAPRDVLAYEVYHPTFSKNVSGYNSTLQVNNLGAYTATVAITLYGAGNTYFATRTISPTAVLVIPASDLSSVPDGEYAVVVDADQPIETLIHTQGSTGGDPLFVYRGIASTEVTTSTGVFQNFFGPFYDHESSALVFNTASVTANVVASFYSTNGLVQSTQAYTVAAHGTLKVLLTTISGWLGSVVISSDQPVTGMIVESRQMPDNVEAYPKPGPAGTIIGLPRVFKSVDEGSGTRTTNLFVGNPYTSTATAVLTFYNANGTPIYTKNYSIPGYDHSAYLDLAGEPALPNGFAGSVVLASDQPVVMGSFTYPPSGAQAASPVGDYELTVPSTTLRLPYLTRTDIGHTVFSVQNLGSATATGAINYYSNAGSFVYSQTLTGVAPGQAQRVDQDSLTGLPSGYIGYAVITADQPLLATVDEYLAPPCTAPSNVQINQTPPNPIYTTTPVTFTASASGSTPFTHTWTIDNILTGGDQDTLEHTFAAVGSYTVGVTVTNNCGAGHADWPVEVLLSPSALSSSYKLVNYTNIMDGDLLTYTLVLRNDSPITAMASLTDPLPAHLLYQAGSIAASSGVVSFTANEAHWQGTIISGTPVIVQYAAQVDAIGLTPGERITNTAQLDDGLGNVIALQASSMYNPGYRLTIDNGALYTNQPTVTLTLSWKTETPPITQMQISNDGGFTTGSGWLAVNTQYAPWILTTYGGGQMPRVVYARFRDGNGLIYGPIQDDIVYDPIVPQITQITIVTQTALSRAANQSVIVRVTSSDDNSGVAAIQISHRADLATYQTFPTTGITTDVPWSLQASGLVFVRVIDRAGNVSAVDSTQGPSHYSVFLPLLMR